MNVEFMMSISELSSVNTYIRLENREFSTVIIDSPTDTLNSRLLMSVN